MLACPAMAVFAVFTYNVTDPERYAKYNPGSLPTVGATVAKHGGEIVFADGDAIYEEGAKTKTGETEEDDALPDKLEKQYTSTLSLNGGTLFKTS